MKLNARDRWIVMGAAATGAIVCLAFVGLFFVTIINNHLPWEHAASAPEHYLAVGKSYSQGFTIGFFLAFSLALVAITFSAWFEDHRRSRGGDTAVTGGRQKRVAADASLAPAAAKRDRAGLGLGLPAPTREPV